MTALNILFMPKALIIFFLYTLQEGCPFIVCMTYAFQTPEKLCFILDLMNGGDLHYHLTQHNVFSESEVRFYAAEVILGLEHMHNRFIVYRDLKVCRLIMVLLHLFGTNSSRPETLLMQNYVQNNH